ncbi:MAG: T9SS type A sorting domain-containing protein [Candidatus Latescibacteria bacterium]|nr:T9SS type A sorting domain-containing protein [Candidatus Latescibacterota bacterium]NIO01053.1 T9SS type A sorting domain-containing protein [Candidatus Latescibacterota bacterium]NIO27452.1 T9SS type A sorting domain-containing protein [Candidatus Latescibacterota bacterium]NIO54974.1 T9SS type A sorting domain-containing protein [Candidatus Latescibacterota bacterium]NIT01063.1 T9SS type A sorting domain-containing protein [Candidatus Latescibacterota bacterium]
MRRLLVVSFCLLFAISSTTLARQAPKGASAADRDFQVRAPALLDLDRPLDQQGLKASVQQDTFVLGHWTFDSGPNCIPDGWTSVDLTPQPCYFHIDDFAGLNGGSFGLLVPLEGNQSLWMGARPDPSDNILCTYARLPGYGNSWQQQWCFKCIDVPDTEEVYIEYLVQWDSEPGFDYTYVEYVTRSTCDSLTHPDIIPLNAWEAIRSYTGTGTKTFVRDTIPSGHGGAVKIRFYFESDIGWSDQDGNWDTDGACIFDSVTVRAEVAGVYDFEDFEDESPGDIVTTDGDWSCCNLSGFGDFAGLYPGIALVQEDPCQSYITCMWAFINGSTETYACGGFPAQFAVPKMNQREQFLFNEIWSPAIPWAGVGATVELVYDVYWDLALDGMVFFIWHVRSWVGGCPQPWRDRLLVYYADDKTWFTSTQDVSDLIQPGLSHIQVALACWDMCGFWCNGYTGDCHSHSPLINEVELRRISTTGPQFSTRDIDLFQDTFPENGSVNSTGRIDAAIDLLPYTTLDNAPGDSVAITIADPFDGIEEPEPISGFGGSVFFYLSIDPPDQPGKMMPSELQEDGFRWPMIDSMFCDGRKWYVFRCDTAFSEPSGPRTGPAQDRWCIDINDHVFTDGDTLWFFFGARNNVAVMNWWTQGPGTTSDMSEACANAMEIQILPGGGAARGGDILYVDDWSGFGVQPYFDSAFEIMGIDELVDRYDVRNPSSAQGNSPGNRVVNVAAQLHPFYRKIIWNCGFARSATIGDGTLAVEKADDFGLLFFFLDQHPDPSGAGIYFSGDSMCEEMATMTGANAIAFIGTYMPHALVSGSHVPYHGVSPLVIGEPGGIFDHGAPFGVDTMVAYGGCPIINDFDMIRPVGDAKIEMTYSGTGNPNDGAVISYDTTNALDNPVAVVLSSFSFNYIRDDRPAGIPDRADHLTDIIRFLRNPLDDPTGAGGTPQFTNSLAQNYPNPFNPSTTIKYSIKARASVSLKIYNVTGQLVKTLVNEEKPAGEYTKGWNGRNDAGNPVSSGVYFYKLVTKNFTQTKKMVLLK